MTDEREYWRSAIVGRIDEQQPIYAGELLDELVDLRAQLAEIRRQRDDYYQKMFSENGLVQEVADMAEKGMEAEADLVMLRESHQKLKAFTRNHLRRVHECLKERTALRKRVEALEAENVKLLADAGDYSGQWDRVSKEDRSEEL